MSPKVQATLAETPSVKLAKTDPMKRLQESLMAAARAAAGGALVRLFRLFESSIDVRAYGMEKLRIVKRRGMRPLIVVWHGKGFVPIAYLQGEQLCLYASTDRDPNYAASKRAFRTLTLEMIRGMGYNVLDASQFASESRGVMSYLKMLREKPGGTIAADGPGGPIYEAKPGACFLAKKAGLALIPVGAAISAGVRLNQWDQFEVPRPFCKSVLIVESPIIVPVDATESDLEQLTEDLESSLNRANRVALEKLGDAVRGGAKAAPLQA